MNVKAKDKATGKEQSVRIEASTGLSKEEIEKMKREAEAHASEDRVKRELVEVQNQADALIYSSEKALREAGDKVSAEIKKEVEDKIAALKKIKESSKEASELKQGMEELSKILSKIGENKNG